MNTFDDQRIEQLRSGLLCIDGEADSQDPFSGHFRLVHRVITEESTSLYQVWCYLNDRGSQVTDFSFIGRDMPLGEAVEQIQDFYVANYRPTSGVYWQRWFGPDQVSVLDKATLIVLGLSSPLVSQLLFRVSDLLGTTHHWLADNMNPVRRKLRAICKESYAPIAQQARVTVFQ